MALTEQQIFAALGVGAQAQEPAEPAQAQGATVDNDPPAGTEPGQEGAQVQEPADPAGNDTDPISTNGAQAEPTAGVADDNNADNGAEGDNTPLSVEERRANAARRRQQEQQAAIDSAVKAALDKRSEEVDAIIANLKIKNSFTGEIITNFEQFKAWQEQHQKEALEKGLQSGKLSPELLDTVISRHPVVQKAQELIEKNAEDAKTAQQEAMTAKVEAEMAEIRKLDPSIQTVADFRKMPNFQQFYELVGKNYSFLDAFRIANFEKLTAAAADVGRQQAASNARSKDHLQATGNSRGAGAAAVPKEDMALYRLMNPHATDAQIQAHYNKNKAK